MYRTNAHVTILIPVPRYTKRKMCRTIKNTLTVNLLTFSGFLKHVQHFDLLLQVMITQSLQGT